VAVLFRPAADQSESTEPSPEQSAPAPQWRKIGEWVAHAGPSRLLTLFTAQLAATAERCTAQGALLFPIEPVPARGSGHYVLAVRLVLARGEEICVATCLLSEVNEPAARECLLRLSLAADVPASYQMNLAGQQARTDVQKFASALDLMVQVNTEKRFLAAALAFCNGLATHFRCDRVSLGYLEGGYIRLRAISRTEKFDRHMTAVRSLEVAMEECLDQDEEIIWPAPESANVVTRDHEAFAREQKVGHIVSLPLRLEDKPMAVVTCERQNEPFTELDLQEMRLCCDQATRRISDLKHHDRWFGARWMTAAKKGCAKLVGPEHTWAKILAIVVTLVLAAFLFLKVNYRVEGNFILRSDEVAFLTVPFDGYIEEVLVRPGDLVPSSGSLLKLETADLELEESAALADLNRYNREAEKARAAENLAEMRISQALAAQAQSRLDLVRYRLAQATILSPFDGVVVEGDLRERIGAPVKQGDALFRVARIDTLYVEAEVSERDVHEILSRQDGEIAFVSQPKLKFPVEIEKIEPAAFPKKEGNIFLVRCRFAEGAEEWFRPGMSGLCKINVEKRTLVWIFTHRTVDFLRMWLWW
jgi:multidrug resistance efflux pump